MKPVTREVVPFVLPVQLYHTPPPARKPIEGIKREGSNPIQVGRVGEQMSTGVQRKGQWGVWLHSHTLTYTARSKFTPSHLSHILQVVLVGQGVQVVQEVQFFHNLVSQVGQVTLEVLWVQ